MLLLFHGTGTVALRFTPRRLSYRQAREGQVAPVVAEHGSGWLHPSENTNLMQHTTVSMTINLFAAARWRGSICQRTRMCSID